METLTNTISAKVKEKKHDPAYAFMPLCLYAFMPLCLYAFMPQKKNNNWGMREIDAKNI